MQSVCKSSEVIEDTLDVGVGPESIVSKEIEPLLTSPSHLPAQPVIASQLPLPKPPEHCLPPAIQPFVSKQTIEPKGPRPVKSIAIAGTPWSVVWSSDNRQFFFNATNRNSVWNIPEDLEYNSVVINILEGTKDEKSRCSTKYFLLSFALRFQETVFVFISYLCFYIVLLLVV